MAENIPGRGGYLDDDLALNRPGATLRVKATEVRQEHPVQTSVQRLLGMHGQERAWRRGAEGEEEVARRLQSLGGDWRVLHSVPIGTGEADIDHVVIGPPGVFTLNTKNHLGKHVTVYDNAILVSRVKQSYLSKSRSEGTRATKLLSRARGLPVLAQPVLVIMASELTFKGTPSDVGVVGRKRVRDWLVRQPTLLTRDEIEAIYAVARWRSTWQQARPAAASDPPIPTASRAVVAARRPTAGWYPDPTDALRQRYWDGGQWTIRERDLPPPV